MMENVVESNHALLELDSVKPVAKTKTPFPKPIRPWMELFADFSSMINDTAIFEGHQFHQT